MLHSRYLPAVGSSGDPASSPPSPSASLAALAAARRSHRCDHERERERRPRPRPDRPDDHRRPLPGARRRRGRHHRPEGRGLPPATRSASPCATAPSRASWPRTPAPRPRRAPPPGRSAAACWAGWSASWSASGRWPSRASARWWPAARWPPPSGSAGAPPWPGRASARPPGGSPGRSSAWASPTRRPSTSRPASSEGGVLVTVRAAARAMDALAILERHGADTGPGSLGATPAGAGGGHGRRRARRGGRRRGGRDGGRRPRGHRRRRRRRRGRGRRGRGGRRRRGVDDGRQREPRPAPAGVAARAHPTRRASGRAHPRARPGAQQLSVAQAPELRAEGVGPPPAAPSGAAGGQPVGLVVQDDPREPPGWRRGWPRAATLSLRDALPTTGSPVGAAGRPGAEAPPSGGSRTGARGRPEARPREADVKGRHNPPPLWLLAAVALAALLATLAVGAPPRARYPRRRRRGAGSLGGGCSVTRMVQRVSGWPACAPAGPRPAPAGAAPPAPPRRRRPAGRTSPHGALTLLSSGLLTRCARAAGPAAPPGPQRAGWWGRRPASQARLLGGAPTRPSGRAPRVGATAAEAGGPSSRAAPRCRRAAPTPLRRARAGHGWSPRRRGVRCARREPGPWGAPRG